MAPNHKDVYVKAFSGLRMGLPVYEPSVDSHLGDIGFIDENEGLFHKLYNVSKPPVNVFDGCPPALEVVASKPRYERLEAIHVSYKLFVLTNFLSISLILIVKVEYDMGCRLSCKCVGRRSKDQESN